MTRPSLSRFLVVAVAALALLGAGCGDDDTDTAPSDQLPLDDAPPAAGACLEGTVDCDDTPGDLAPPDLEPGDSDEPGAPVDLPDDGVLTPEEALGLGTSDEQIAVRGSYFDDGRSGPYLCGALAESFPPQCGGGALVIVGLDEAVLDTALASSGGVTWSDQAVTLSGTLDNGVLTVADVE